MQIYIYIYITRPLTTQFSTNYPKQPSVSPLDVRHTQIIQDPCQANPTIRENLSESTPVNEQLCLFCGDEPCDLLA